MIAAITEDERSGLLVLLPDHTLQKSSDALLTAFLTDFRTIEESPLMKGGGEGVWKGDDIRVRRARLIAYVTDEHDLILFDFAPFAHLLAKPAMDSPVYLRSNDYADLVGKSRDSVRYMCKTGRIPGAVKREDRSWSIPLDAPYPG